MNNQRSVSSILRSARLSKGIDLGEASKVLKIHPRFLRALEDGDYAAFSSPVHLKGFLKNYAAFLGLNVEEILAFFRREYPEEDVRGPSHHLRPLETRLPILTPERIVPSFIGLLVLVFLAYLFFQYRSFSNAPELVLREPRHDYRTQEATIRVSGKTSSGSVLRINGQEIQLDDQGNFETAITLLDGVNILSFVTENKLGKERRLIRTIVLERELADQASVPESSESAQLVRTGKLRVEVQPNAAWVEVFGLSDDRVFFQGLMLSGVWQDFSDPVGFRVKTGNAGSTSVTFADQPTVFLGREGEVIEREFRR